MLIVCRQANTAEIPASKIQSQPSKSMMWHYTAATELFGGSTTYICWQGLVFVSGMYLRLLPLHNNTHWALKLMILERDREKTVRKAVRQKQKEAERKGQREERAE